MPRLMSVTLTEQAVVEHRKTVTRRAGWLHLRVGDELDLCRKVMGRRKGDPLVRLARVRVMDVRRERLDAITDDDVRREGCGPEDKPGWWRPSRLWSPRRRFIAFYCAEMGGDPNQEVTRIEWEYLPGTPWEDQPCFPV